MSEVPAAEERGIADCWLTHVGLVGHRRKLLNAIAALRADVKHESAATGLSKTLPSAAAMISNLVGSTARSARLDPEDMRAVIDAFTPPVPPAMFESRQAPVDGKSPLSCPNGRRLRPAADRPSV